MLASYRYNTFRDLNEEDVESLEEISQSKTSKIVVYLEISLAVGVLVGLTLLVHILAENLKYSQSTLLLTEKSKQNVVFIIIDDLSWNSIGYMPYDLTFATPTLTALAKKGVILTNYYTQEHCTPSRAALLTGRYPLSLGMQFGDILPNQEWGLPLNETLLPQVLSIHGYKNYAVGKWNLGHFTPKYLPTARVFDEFIGMLGAEEYYWSKYTTREDPVVDFLTANTTCYSVYNNTNRNEYSTKLYTHHVQRLIKEHNFNRNPMFMYFAVQAVHQRFYDAYETAAADGIPQSYLSPSMYQQVLSHVSGNARQQYAMVLILLDNAVRDLLSTLTKAGQIDNTYIVVASDNGGCAAAGGQNWPLRGTKGSLFEGGTKVNAFIVGPNISENQKYSALFHVSDWVPTMLDLLGVTQRDASAQFDGVSHAHSLRSSELSNIQDHIHTEGTQATDTTVVDSPRRYLLYNIYTNVEGKAFDIFTNANAAVRNSRYKLIHAFVNNSASLWYPYDNDTTLPVVSMYHNNVVNTVSIAVSNESISETEVCPLFAAMEGSFALMLFDLQHDPYETSNLYNNRSYRIVQEELTAVLQAFAASARREHRGAYSTTAATYWVAHGGFLGPFQPAAETTTTILQSCLVQC